MGILKNFIFYQTKESFDRDLSAETVDEESIVFIKDINRIWTHGTFFPGIYIYTFTIVPKPEDATVIINDKERTSVQLWYGDEVEWSVSKSGYITQSGSLTLEEDTTLTVELELGIDDGVYLGYKDAYGTNRISKPDDWKDSLGEIQGMFIKDGPKTLLVGMTDAGRGNQSPDNTLIDGCFTTESEDEAANDFAGKENTAAYMVMGGDYTSTKYAPGMCAEYSCGSIPAGEWWEPSCGECLLIQKWFSDCQNILSEFGGEKFDIEKNYWSSTQFNSDNGWEVYIAGATFDNWGKTKVNAYVRAVTSFEFVQDD